MKNLDLTSKEWCDIIFEGKNKDFGAYEMRMESPKRHNKAVLYTVIGAILVFAAAFGLAKYNEYRAEQQRLLDEARQRQIEMEMAKQMQEEEKEDEPIIEEKKIEEQPKEEVAEQKVTELAIVEDSKVKEEVKTQTEINLDDKQVGNKDVDSENKERLNTFEDRKEAAPKVDIPEPPKPKEEAPKPVKDEVFKAVEQMPEFPGGQAALLKWISSHIQYPAMAAENNIQGKVTVQFVVTKTGSIGEVKVVRSVDKDLDREAVRVVKSLPKFNPGRQNGQPVSVWYTLPVNFKLQGTN